MTRRTILLSLALFLFAGCATRPLPPPPTVEDIVQWSKENMPAEQIIQRMEASRAVYRLPASELAELRSRGVPDKVIDYMQQTYIAAERWDEYQRTRDQYFFYGWPGYPGFYPYGPFWGMHYRHW